MSTPDQRRVKREAEREAIAEAVAEVDAGLRAALRAAGAQVDARRETPGLGIWWTINGTNVRVEAAAVAHRGGANFGRDPRWTGSLQVTIGDPERGKGARYRTRKAGWDFAEMAQTAIASAVYAAGRDTAERERRGAERAMDARSEKLRESLRAELGLYVYVTTGGRLTFGRAAEFEFDEMQAMTAALAQVRAARKS